MVSKKNAFNNPAHIKRSGINSPIDKNGRAALHINVAEGDMGTVTRLLKLPVDLNQKDNAGQSPLYTAIATKNMAMVKVLLDNGAHFRINDNAGRTPLMWAIEQGCDPAFLEQLRQLGCPINAKSKTDQRTALHTAAALNLPEIVDYLVRTGATIDFAGSAGKTPLHAAVEAKAHDALRRLLASGASPLRRTAQIETPLHIAISAGDETSVDILLAETAVQQTVNDFRTHQEGFTPLLTAVALNHAKVVKRLLALGADPNARDLWQRHSLFIAAELGHLEIARLLIDAGADVEKAPTSGLNNETILHRVGGKNSPEMLKILHAAGADMNVTNANGRTPLYFTISQHDLLQAEALLDLGADPNIHDRQGLRPIDFATSMIRFSGNPDPTMIELLLKRGAKPSPSPVPNAEQSPLLRAAARGQRNIVQLLLKYGASVDDRTTDFYNATPFLLAAQSGHVDVCRLLLENDADPLARDGMRRTVLHLVAAHAQPAFLEELCNIPELQKAINAQSDEGRTALHHACVTGGVDYARILLGKGANLFVHDSQGLTPMHYVVSHYDTRLLDLFAAQKAGKDIWNVPSKESADTPLHRAVSSLMHSQDTIEEILELGADITLKNKTGMTPFHLAVSLNSFDIVQTFIRHLALRKIHPDDLRDHVGQTAFHHLLTRFNPATADALLAAGADINLCNDDGDTPLHRAVRGWDLAVASYLIEKKARLDIPNAAGDTPMDIAARAGNQNMISRLTTALKEQEAQQPPPPRQHHPSPPGS